MLHVLKQGQLISYMLFSDGCTKDSHEGCFIIIQVTLRLLKRLSHEYKHIHEDVHGRDMFTNLVPSRAHREPSR